MATQPKLQLLTSAAGSGGFPSRAPAPSHDQKQYRLYRKVGGPVNFDAVSDDQAIRTGFSFLGLERINRFRFWLLGGIRIVLLEGESEVPVYPPPRKWFRVPRFRHS